MQRQPTTAYEREPEEPAFYDLRLYIANSSPRSANALAAVSAICRDHLAGRHRLEIVDIKQDPRRAFEDQIVAVPVLVRALPEPRKALVGDLLNIERAMAGLGLAQPDPASGL